MRDHGALGGRKRRAKKTFQSLLQDKAPDWKGHGISGDLNFLELAVLVVDDGLVFFSNLQLVLFDVFLPVFSQSKATNSRSVIQASKESVGRVDDEVVFLEGVLIFKIIGNADCLFGNHCRLTGGPKYRLRGLWIWTLRPTMFLRNVTPQGIWDLVGLVTEWASEHL